MNIDIKISGIDGYPTMTSLKVAIRTGVATRNHIKASYNDGKNRVKIVFDCPLWITSATAVANTCRDVYRALTSRHFDPRTPLVIDIDTNVYINFDADALRSCLQGELVIASPSPTHNHDSIAVHSSPRDLTADLVPRLLSWIQKHPHNSPDFYPVNDKEWQKVVNWVNSVTASKFTREDLAPVIQKLRQHTAP